MLNDTALELINQIDEFTELHDFMQDDEFSEALSIIVKLTLNPEVPSAKAIPLIVQLQALAAKMSTMSVVYTTLHKGKTGTVDNTKKQVYYSIAESLNRLVDALKYSAKFNVV